MRRWPLTLGLLLMLGLSACPVSPPPPEYRLVALLPTPVTPGDTVVAYGLFPPHATITLDGAPLAATPVTGGLRFVVPVTQTAGLLNVGIAGDGIKLEGRIELNPRIDRAELSGSTLRVIGAGWPPNTGSVARLELGGLPVETHLDASSAEPSLVATLSTGGTYGPLVLRVLVGTRSSGPFNLLREAGSVQGHIVLPANGLSKSPLRAGMRLNRTTPTRDMIVTHRPSALESLHLAGLERRKGFVQGDHIVTHLRFGSATSAEEAWGHLTSLAGVEHLEWDRGIRVSDAAISPQGIPVEAPAQPGAGQWYLPLMGLPLAQTAPRGQGVVVAVVDTGVLLTHPDLQANLLPGWDFVTNTANPLDQDGHGTHVAGLIAANGLVLGTAQKAKILPVRVLGGASGGSPFAVAQGILWAAGLLQPDPSNPQAPPPNPTPAQVINLSLGTPDFSQVLADAVVRAQKAGVIVVAAAGNSGAGLDYPAALPGVVSVTALAGPITAYQPGYAGTGPGLQLTAYGGDTTQDQDGNGVPDGVLSTDRRSDGRSGYGLRMGTSMAAPLVAGLVAATLSSHPPSGLASDSLAHTATDLGVMGYDERFGFGLATGRAAATMNPRTYVVALDAQSQVVGWTLTQPDQTFTLTNLPPGQPFVLVAASDENGNGVLGEAGERLSAPIPVVARAGQTLVVETATLNPTDGTHPVTLKKGATP